MTRLMGSLEYSHICSTTHTKVEWEIAQENSAQSNSIEVHSHDSSCRHVYFKVDILAARDFCGSSQKTLTLYLCSLLLKFSFRTIFFNTYF